VTEVAEGGEFPFRGGVTLRAGFDNLICHPPPSLHTPQRMTFIMGSVLKTPLHPLHPVCHRHQHGSGTNPISSCWQLNSRRMKLSSDIMRVKSKLMHSSLSAIAWSEKLIFAWFKYWLSDLCYSITYKLYREGC